MQANNERYQTSSVCLLICQVVSYDHYIACAISTTQNTVLTWYSLSFTLNLEMTSKNLNRSQSHRLAGFHSLKLHVRC